jgi:2-aminoethylphosphonate-pyruvate transaminase
MKKNFKNFIRQKNQSTKLFTPGPASLVLENITGLRPCFGRGDFKYDEIEKRVLKNILKISGHKNIARLQGAASLALEIMISNFLFGNILIINTGVYSDRLKYMSETSKRKYNFIKKIDYVSYKELDQISKKYDWVMACPVETSIGYKIPIEKLFKIKKKCRSKLALDATASIGLENNHKLSDVAAFSSCKGLFGLTGGAVITFNEKSYNEVNEFNLNILNHLGKKMTGPYHAICSLDGILKDYKNFSYSVKLNKKIFIQKMKEYLLYPNKNQPNLCTLINKKIDTLDKSVVLYQSRADIKGSVVCHLGEVHLKKSSKGRILDYLKVL